MSDIAFNHAMQALQDAHDRYLKTMRVMTGVLLTLGITPDIAETILGPVDDAEQAQDLLCAQLRALREVTS